MIRDFKARIFCREVGYATKEIDAADPLWVSPIDDFFRTNAILPPDGDPTEYSAAFEAVFPQERHRRQYIDDAVRLGTPSFAHRVLASLMSSGKLNCVFTTNFDSLVETAVTLTDQLLPAGQRAMPTLAALDSADRASRCVAESDWPLIAKLHGDYTSTKIKNTNSELEHQDERMRAVLVEACKRFGLVVVGYSGRDTSVMEALESLLRFPNAYPSGLHWVCSSKSKLLPAVTQFLENAALAGVDVNVVESKNFDELAGDLIKQVALPDVLLEHVMQRKAPPRLQPVKLQTTDARAFPVLRYSALLVESVPTTARRILLSKAANTSDVRTLLKEQGCRAVVSCQGRLLAAFGNDAQLLAALQPFDAKLDGTIALDPENDSWALGLIYDALTQALARRRPLAPRFKRAGHGLVVIRTRPDDDTTLVSRRESELGPLKAAYESSLTGTVLPVMHWAFASQPKWARKHRHIQAHHIDALNKISKTVALTPAIIPPLPHQRQPDLAIRHGNTREDGHPLQRSRPDALVHAIWRAGWGDLRVCRLLWGRFASPAVGPATLVWRRDGEPLPIPERLS
ncbi:SIR2 family protein [Ralstonia pseudosolanacearum]|uniref:SIR2 family protein n=1 Tax=Ralstonia solanacearum TaxID=305 RepID=A0AA92JY93_RALSL|nr:SIR2 family protein [Ralstonia pseudosolanacearum]QOK90039.1 SIR2 family protein [Ralstonia pseudosolanacearum]QOK95000.1 SIR2 family protein [Ralstonia pseudosolanacearum]UWD90970.1 SIR2 family protein [Ralstonia pseudosolanacearum]CAH0442627.1 hypothetical protein LMG9673_03442 [Ralstonia pseudosolanacearum]